MLQMWVIKNSFFGMLRGYYTPNQELACFVLYLKIINIFFFFWKIIYASQSILSKEFKNGIEIWVGQAI